MDHQERVRGALGETSRKIQMGMGDPKLLHLGGGAKTLAGSQGLFETRRTLDVLGMAERHKGKTSKVDVKAQRIFYLYEKGGGEKIRKAPRKWTKKLP